MNLTQTLRLGAFFIGTIIVASGFADLGTLGNAETFTFLSNGGNGVLKVVIGLILMVLGIRPNSILAIINLTFGKE